MKFRIASQADVKDLATIYRAAVMELGPTLYTPEQVAAWSGFADKALEFSRFILGSDTFVAESEDGRPLGFAGLEEDGHIASLYVAPDSTRMGVGSQLLGRVLEEAESRGIEMLYAEASFLSKDLFLRFGFHVDSVEEALYDGVRFKRFKVVLRR